MRGPRQHKFHVSEPLAEVGQQQHAAENGLQANRQHESIIVTSNGQLAIVVSTMILCFALVGLVSAATSREKAGLTLHGKDQNIVATAVPAMTRHFGTVDQIGWYLSI